ncbi:hypothetical protein PanWU01x14_221350 [Parasponia andersonii]|uniref:Uncharacterized protein n=1 Tax=Parasponia andersonii TaxID=3476 RepID=A0A2P5BPR6_PARAD|nr:hypothetical protein PanWU01x14_221350 [Parasponia andersonii]
MPLSSYFSHLFPSSLPAAASLLLPLFLPFFLVNKEIFVLNYKAKKETLKSYGKMWRDFKSRITTELIYEYRHTCPELLEHPPASYAPWIEPKVWDMFVNKRVSAEWEEAKKVQ